MDGVELSPPVAGVDPFPATDDCPTRHVTDVGHVLHRNLTKSTPTSGLILSIWIVKNLLNVQVKMRPIVKNLWPVRHNSFGYFSGYEQGFILGGAKNSTRNAVVPSDFVFHSTFVDKMLKT